MDFRNDNDDKILIAESDDLQKIQKYHSKWYGAYKINLTKEMIESLNEGKILLYNNDEYSFEIKKVN